MIATIQTHLPLLDLQGFVLSSAMILSVFSVFLGMLFAMRYHNFYEKFDEILIDAGVEGFSPGQKNQLKFVRSMIFSGLGVFVAGLLVWMLFGLPPDAEHRWAFIVACVGLGLLDIALVVAATLDIRNGITRPWLRYLVLSLGVLGCVGATLAVLTLESLFGIA